MLEGAQSNFVLNPSCHPSSYFKLAYLPSSWQLDGLYTPSLILPLDLRLGAAAPLGTRPGASWAHLGRPKWPSKKNTKILKIHWFFSLFWSPQARQLRTRWPKITSRCSQDGVRKMVLHIKAILDRLGLDFGRSWGRLCASWAPSWLQLGVQDRSKSRP